MPISKVHSSAGGNNAGSCSALVNYLEKENAELDKMEQETDDFASKMDFESRKQDFFNHNKSNIGKMEVSSTIDTNKRKLTKSDAKFFAPTLSFSENELKHLAQKATGRDDVKSVWEMKPNEMKKYNEMIRDYARRAMDNYAKNFNRQDKGLESGKDLVYFGKIEHMRKYKGTDKEVQQGIVKSGQKKPGFQSHVHLIISRKDKEQRLKLSPTTKERNTTRTIGKNKYRVGFDRSNWIDKNEKDFDKMFDYRRQELEKFKNQNILKNGTEKERQELQKKLTKQSQQKRDNQLEI